MSNIINSFKTPFEDQQIQLINLQTGKKFQANAHFSLSNKTIFCEVTDEKSKLIGRMTLGIGKEDIHIATLTNTLEGKVGHLGSGLVELSKKISASLGHKGNLSVVATKSAHGFFYRTGFVPFGSKREAHIAAIESAIKLGAATNKRADTYHLPGILMHNYKQ